MNDYLNILLLALMPAAGNFVGGVGAELFKVSPKMLSFALHLAAGIVLAVVGVELMPSALAAAKPWIVIAAFVLGGIFFTVIDKVIDYVQNRFGKGKGNTSAWSIYFAVSIDLFSDGIMIGSGSAIAASLGLLLALGQVPADVPEGFATIATFKKLGVSRGTRILLAASFTIPIVLGATISYFAVRDSDELVKLSLLAFTAGILFIASIEEMISEAHREYDKPMAGIFLVLGFALFAFLTAYLEGS